MHIYIYIYKYHISMLLLCPVALIFTKLLDCWETDAITFLRFNRVQAISGCP